MKQKIQVEKQSLTERLSSVQRTLAAMENEKREVERSTVRLEKDKSALRKTLDKVELYVLDACRGLLRTQLTYVIADD